MSPTPRDSRKQGSGGSNGRIMYGLCGASSAMPNVSAFSNGMECTIPSYTIADRRHGPASLKKRRKAMKHGSTNLELLASKSNAEELNVAISSDTTSSLGHA